jgi:nicotinate dehydrogenase subunit B
VQAGPVQAGAAQAGQARAGAAQAGHVRATGSRPAGQPARPAGAADVVTGAKKFPSDLRLEGMLHGCVLHPPAARAQLRSIDTSAAAALAGVTVVRDGTLTGVLAADYQTARAGLAAITADWNEQAGPQGTGDLESYLRAHPAGGEGMSAPFRHLEGDPEGALGAGPVRVEAHYSVAYVAHVPMEPRAALARWQGDQLEVWAATSTPFRARRELAEALGVPEAAVRVVVPDFGGGFGGKHGSAVALEAALLARAAGRPVKVQWSRHDEFSSGYLRPAAFIDVASAADATGQLTGWSFTNINSGAAGIMIPYRVPNQRITYQPASAPLAQGSYRALAATANGFARESHLDELASAVGADPVQFRLRHLDDDRLAAVLSAAASEIGWDPGASPSLQSPAGGRTGTGIALGLEKGGRVATAARVHVSPDGAVSVLELITAVDCGAVVYPDGLINQVEGAVMMGLGPALFEQIEFAGSRVLNGSMSQYRVPRLADLPADLRVLLLDQPYQASAGGGEAPIVAVAPAIANAISRACGVRLRSLPLVPDGRVPGIRGRAAG